VDVRLEEEVIKADQPPALGGKDAGPKPVEFALAALGSCQAMTYRFWSEKLGIRFDDIRVDVEGDLDVQGILGLRDGVRPRLRRRERERANQRARAAPAVPGAAASG
jgi:OsmC-like protein